MKLRLFAFIVALSINFWGILLIIADHFGATFPTNSLDKISLALIALVVEFLIIKIYLMITRTDRLTNLGLSLIGTNISFLIAYVVALFLAFWPQFAGNTWIKYGLRVQIIMFISWGIYQLLVNAHGKDARPSVAVVGWTFIMSIIVMTIMYMQFSSGTLADFIM